MTGYRKIGRDDIEYFGRALGAPLNHVKNMDIAKVLVPDNPHAPADNDNIIIMGKPGVGKSYEATRIGMISVGRSQRTIFLRWPLFVLRMRVFPTYSDKDVTTPTKSTLLDEAVYTAVVILDDIGSERPADDAIDLLQTILSERMDAERRTIVTTNLNADALHVMYGERVASRLAAFKSMTITGRDRRRG